MIESILFERTSDGGVRLSNEHWPRRIHIDAAFLDLIRQDKANDSMYADGDTVVFVATNGSATYRSAGPCEGEHPEYRLERCHLVLDT